VVHGDDSAPENVVLASFPTRRAAEHMVATLGHDFRHTALKRHATALVVSANRDGSLRLKKSRMLRASGFTSTLIHLSLSWTVGFLGIISSFKGIRRDLRAHHVHEGHVGSEEHRAHEILAEAGPQAVVVLIRCTDEEIWPHVTKQAGEHSSHNWQGSREKFLAAVAPSSDYDWVRAALNAPL
jgi:hypothetical protein